MSSVEAHPETVGQGELRRTARFPSVRWFELLGDLMNRQRSRFEHLGYVDCVAEFCVTDVVPEPFVVQVVFEEFGVAEVRKPTAGERERADFRVEGRLVTRKEMIESIVRNGGRPDLSQTLNYLTHMGTPMRVIGSDPIRRDLYFRYAQSLQEFFNNAASIDTQFEE
jgi:hypothetical protein